MPRYFFDFHDSRGFHPDDYGDELVDLEEARKQARAALPELPRQKLPDGVLHTVICDVRDEPGQVVYRVETMFRGARIVP